MDTIFQLGALALLDSLSIGTLVIPVALVIRQRRVNHLALEAYGATVYLVYFALGIALLLGFNLITGLVSNLNESTAFAWVKLLVGIGLAAWGILSPNPKKDKKPTAALKGKPANTRLKGMIALGLGASLTEAITMVPYLAAMGIMHTTDWNFAAQMFTLAIYCVVMFAPAIVLIGLMALFQDKIFAKVERLLPRLEYEAKVTLLWIAAIVGIWLIGQSIGDLRG